MKFCLLAALAAGVLSASPLGAGQPMASGDVAVLSSDRLNISFSLKTGNVVQVADRGRTICTGIEPSYEMIRKDLTTAFSGEGDVVSNYRQASSTAISFTVTNPNFPGFSIEKEYHLEGDGNRLTQKIGITFNETQEAFFAVASHVRLAGDFRAGGFYSDPARHPRNDPRLPVDKIVKPTKPRIENEADWHRVIFTTKTFDASILHERTRINGRAVTPITNHNYEETLEYDAAGWTLGLDAFHIEKGKTVSAEWAFQLVDGDQVKAWLEAQKLPGYQDLHVGTPPEWIKNIRYFIHFTYGGNEEGFKTIQDILDSTQDGDILVLISQLWGEAATGMYPTQGEWPGVLNKVSGADVRSLVDRLHALSPRVKVTVYTWWWGFSAKSDFGKQHPEWLLRDAKGDYRYTQIGPNLERTFAVHLTPQLRQHMLDRVSAIIKDFDLDMYYVDGGQGGVADLDWPSVSKSSDEEWMNLYQEMLGRIRAAGKDRAFWSNGTTGLFTAYTDCGFFEGFNEPADWRALSERMMQVKAFQDKGKWTSPLYLQVSNAQRYLNLMFLLGLSPAAYSTPYFSGQKLATQQAPMELLAELKNSKLAGQSDFSPKWWRGEGDEEIYLFKLAGSILLTGMTHAKSDAKVATTVSLADYPSLQHKNLLVWNWKLAGMEFCNELRAPYDRESADLYKKYGLAPNQLVGVHLSEVKSSAGDSISFDFNLMSQQPGAVYISSAPGVVIAEMGRPLQTWQASTAQTEISGELDPVKKTLDASVEAKVPAQALFVFPACGVKATLDGAPVQASYRAGIVPSGWSAVTMEIPPGQHEIHLLPEAASAEVAAPLKTLLEEQNGELRLSFDGAGAGTAAATLLRDDIPVAWLERGSDGKGAATLSIPTLLLEPGKYRAVVDVSCKNLPDSNVVTVVPPLPKLVSGLVNQADLSVTENGTIKILRSWQQTVGHSEYNFASANRKALKLDVGLGADVYGFGYAGFDIEKAESLLLQVKLTPPEKGGSYLKAFANFLGLTIDFHTSSGWTRRAWISIGVQTQRPGPNFGPAWGTHSSEEAKLLDCKYTDLIRQWKDGEERKLWVDLKSYAPEDWDGRIILGAADMVSARGTRLECAILGANVPNPGGACLVARQDEDLVKVAADRGWDVKSSPNAVKGLEIEASVFDQKLSPAEADSKTGKITLSGPRQAGGFLATNAVLLTVDVSKNNLVSGAWLAVDYLAEEGGFSKRVILPLRHPKGQFPLTPLPDQKTLYAEVDASMATSESMQFDLMKYAPENWKGPAVLWLVSGEMSPGGKLIVRLVENVDSYRY